ncbi:macrophage mannose receptor 1-like isoform X2 [Festucalex cinctus]
MKKKSARGLLAILLLVVGGWTPRVTCGCPSNWRRNGEQCYFISDVEKTFTEAEDDCRARGGHLTSLQDAQERYWLKSYIGQERFWIGLRDELKNGQFWWTDRSPVTQVSVEWSHAEPNNLGGKEYCVEMGLYSRARLNDLPCNSLRKYICKRASVLCDCPTGWRSNGDECYFFSGDKKTWNQAQIDCWNKKSELTSIQDAKEKSWLSRQIGLERYWIGLWDPSFLWGYWQWSDGSPLVKSQWDWYPGRPEEKYKYCAVIAGDLSDRWHDYTCRSDKFKYICKRANSPPTRPPTPPPCLPRGALLQPAAGEGDVPSVETSPPAPPANSTEVPCVFVLDVQQGEFLANLSGLLDVGRRIVIRGRVREVAKSFAFGLSADDGPALVVHPDLQTQNTTLNYNSLVSWKVLRETEDAAFPFAPRSDFEIVIGCEAQRFHVSMDGDYWLDSAYGERVQPGSSLQSISTLAVGGDVDLMYIQLM